MRLEQWSHIHPLAGSISARSLTYQLQGHIDFLCPPPRAFARKVNSSADRNMGVARESEVTQLPCHKALMELLHLLSPCLAHSRLKTEPATQSPAPEAHCSPTST